MRTSSNREPPRSSRNPSEILSPLLQLYDIEGQKGRRYDREAYRGRLHHSLRTLVHQSPHAGAGRGAAGLALGRTHRLVDILRQLAAEPLGSTLTLYNYRPEFAFHEGGIREIKLSELSDRDTRELTESLLDADSVPNELVTFLDQRTGGNPFFLEEIVNSLLENHFLTRTEGWTLTGHSRPTAVTTTSSGVIAARIDGSTPTPVIPQEEYASARVSSQSLVRSEGRGDSRGRPIGAGVRRPDPQARRGRGPGVPVQARPDARGVLPGPSAEQAARAARARRAGDGEAAGRPLPGIC